MIENRYICLGKEFVLPSNRKLDPKVGLVGLSPLKEQIFADCFKQFHIQTVSVPSQAALALQREKFEGIVLPINENAGEILKAERNTASNKRITIFGVCQQVKDILPYASYSINVTLEEPLDPAAVFKVVSATHLLILNEFRRYLRVPVVLPVRVATASSTTNGFSLELSAGGMSLLVPAARFHEGEACTVTFSLPQSPSVPLLANVCWTRESGNLLGVKFSEGQEGCNYVKKWIDEYLGMK